MSDSLLAYCRPGFEGELAAALAGSIEGSGYARAKAGDGWVRFHPSLPLPDAIDLNHWIYARQALRLIGECAELPATDRVGAILAALPPDKAWRDVWIEHPDSDAGRELATLCRKLTHPLRAALQREGRMDDASGKRPRLHVFLPDGQRALIAASMRGSSEWQLGIPRLRFPTSAPSRSTLKLEEAFLTLLSEDERERWLQPGMRAVDLGAAPGGWTWQLVRRSIRVTAIDNGPMQPALMESGIVEHLRTDGFRWRPPKAVDWMVCDMVETPIRVAELTAQWLADGHCRRAMINLKLPMKKRHDEVTRCFARMREIAGDGLELRARQLYHDREEITVFATAGAR